MRTRLTLRMHSIFNVRSAVSLTLIIGYIIRRVRRSLPLKIVVFLWLLYHLLIWVEIHDNNLWLVFYVADVSIVISCAILSNFLGFSGFFVITAISSLSYTLIWALQFSRFILEKRSTILEFGPLSKFPGLDTGLVIYVDHLSYSFSLLTALISLYVYAYAFSYMRFEKNILNFLVYFKLFGWSMIFLVMAGSWFTLLLGWELIGITSFLLINFWVSKITTLKSAFKAFVFNKISDAALIGAVCLNLYLGAFYVNTSSAFIGAISSSHINVCGANYSYASINLLLLIIAASCKSAQFGFHFWLPDSMEAPVPASALIHSATLVSAGIYLLLRHNSLFLACPALSIAFGVITAFTSFYGAVIASVQTDVKKILAYSTISHCGMIMFSILMQSPSVTLFYLFAHGFFKSINFMCVGNFIQASNNYQDVSRMGRFFALLPFELYFFSITLFNLSSGPLFFCFFSKHWLMGLAYTNGVMSSISVCLVYATAFCGIFYSSKLLFECMLSHKKAHRSTYAICHQTINSKKYRRSNALGRAAMLGLFLTAFVVLFALWQDASLGLVTIDDDYMSLADASLVNGFYAVHVWFSLVLAVIASSYITYKRGNALLMPTVIMFTTVCVLSLIV